MHRGRTNLGGPSVAGLCEAGRESEGRADRGHRPRLQEKRTPGRGVLLLLSCVGIVGCAGPSRDTAAPREVRVAAASDLQFAFAEMTTGFTKRHPDIAVNVIYGSSGNFYTQLASEAPFDLFLSADRDYPRKLVEQGKAVKETEFQYAVGRLVVWVPNGSPLDLDKLGLRATADVGVKKVAIANPRHAPYGRAAEAALKHAGVYDQVKARLVLGENISQSAQFVESGAADVGLIALSLALAPTLKERGRYWEVPAEAHPRLDQGGVELTWAKDKAATKALREFLTGADGRAVLRKYGFRLPGE
jgi:molybdate transport system substrate-binding protein